MNSVISKTSERAALQWLAAVCLFTATLAFSQTTTAQQSEPSREPILRIETGMHTAVIRRIGVDRGGRFLVTASEDKTVRVWELATGRILRVLRPPIGDVEEGMLFSVAISPEGETVVVGGFTLEGDKGENIYFFDRQNGKLIHRVSGLPNAVNHLVYSVDGRYLAATLKSTSPNPGILVFNTQSYELIGRDKQYSDESYGADFDHAGRLVTSSYDGSIRLYDRSFRLLAKRKALGGKQPFGVRFSPDGRKVAVGYKDSRKVDVLSGDTLTPLYSADTSGVNNGNFHSVAWSRDGTLLYAGGMYQDKPGSIPIRRWSDAGRGSYVDTTAASNTIMDIASLPSGGIV